MRKEVYIWLENHYIPKDQHILGFVVCERIDGKAKEPRHYPFYKDGHAGIQEKIEKEGYELRLNEKIPDDSE